MDNEEDDDGNFTKWMSSYWGHGDENSKERKRSFRRPSRYKADRRASLPSMSQLEAMQVNHLHANNMAPLPVHLKSREEKEVHSHPRARRVSSDENSRTKVGGPECHITTIPELSECLEKRLRFHNQKVISMGDADSICLICHEELRNGRGGIQELNCSHHFHKETVLTKWPEHRTRPRSGSSAPACERGKETPFCPGQEEYRLPRRQLSLRRQR
ncbi:leukemia NUP98 fusion partner 1 [Ctenopharyngodon idella]|uniref:leukemia NUP98 fusion partner 1 n=1 Tax=Ctenopharyngodon idella TaxID=7959 RepID=UPI00222E7998|nr:leukemia NUP98 fusion partner 1 [Ctenopharyngodon idella]